jgi:23S rRNA pseudouridine1911/1915/1917 synthase
VRVQLETGRTHQIRVHLAHAGFPLVGDSVYGGRLAMPAGISESLRQTLSSCPRQALPSARLELSHPVTGKPLECHSPRPGDLDALLAALQADVDEQQRR